MTSVKAIYIYPIKSMGPIDLDKAYAEDRGFRDDRRWLITDEKDRFLTQREIPEMALFKPVFDSDDIKILFGKSISPGIKTVVYKEKSSTKVWNDKVETSLAPEEINQWFSDHLNRPIRLHRLTEQTIRSKNNGQVSFADRWPYLVLSMKSVEDLGMRLNKEVNVLNFRPNIVVDNVEPYEEENWKDFWIGDIPFEGKGKCGRCVMINIDQKSGKSDERILKTLGSYRKEGKSIPLGLLSKTLKEGWIETGMIVS